MRSDWMLIRRARDGDESAWRELISRHRPRLMKLALLVSGDPPAAEDAVQETFVRLLDYGEEQTKGSFAALAGTIVYRLALKERLRANKQAALEGFDQAGDTVSPLEAVLNREQDRQLVKALFALDESHRDILILRFYGEHDYSEIAKLTGLPLGTVKSRIFYAVKKCREKMKRET
ncbi:RNA polymerase sigma factor [bacterium]|nr:RNA polymerase sigma factor [bacterium]MBU1919874.1 RNA polymerase sigma factor [bacterium]